MEGSRWIAKRGYPNLFRAQVAAAGDPRRSSTGRSHTGGAGARHASLEACMGGAGDLTHGWGRVQELEKAGQSVVPRG